MISRWVDNQPNIVYTRRVDAHHSRILCKYHLENFASVLDLWTFRHLQIPEIRDAAVNLLTRLSSHKYTSDEQSSVHRQWSIVNLLPLEARRRSLKKKKKASIQTEVEFCDFRTETVGQVESWEFDPPFPSRKVGVESRTLRARSGEF